MFKQNRGEGDPIEKGSTKVEIGGIFFDYSLMNHAQVIRQEELR